ncbi:MAG: HAMP domain-containing sensor histidine kinase [Planctomycetota bacterium]
MLRNMQIRKKILLSTLILMITLIPLGWYGWRGVSGYRELTINLEKLSGEITSRQRLGEGVQELKDQVLQQSLKSLDFSMEQNEPEAHLLRFQHALTSLLEESKQYQTRIENQHGASNPLLASTSDEREAIAALTDTLETLDRDWWNLGSKRYLQVHDRLGRVTDNLRFLSSRHAQRMLDFRDQTRIRYRSWQVIVGVCAIASLVNVVVMFIYFRHWVVKPFKQLLLGSKRIAEGEFEHRISLESQDELSDLAQALNGMTDRFLQIRDNLNDQVRQRTQEVVRSEQLASVGFLAAGVAHEINNPIASIAWSAEALESRIHEVIHDDADKPSCELSKEQTDVLRDYLRRIQEEAFRCKDITERLLDFSRLGESSKKQETDIHEAVSDVCELVSHLGQYRNRKLQFAGTPGFHAWVSPTEFKQVVLNLLTNALDASEDGSVVDVILDAQVDDFRIQVIDQGCGMTQEVSKQLFEPFFTRRRDGRGTGLGLSITYRIVQDHGGSLVPFSAGPGTGSTMTLILPIHSAALKSDESRRAA